MKKNIVIVVFMSICAHSLLSAAPTWRKGYPYNKDEMVERLNATNFDTFLRLTDYSFSAYTVYRGVCFASRMVTIFNASEYKSLHTFSADQIVFAPLTPYSQHKLMQLSIDDFTVLLQKKLANYSEQEQIGVRKKIVMQYNLYQFPGFVGAISAWSEFEEQVTALATIFEQNPEVRKQFAQLQGFKDNEFPDFIKTYYSKISNQS